MKNIKSLAVLVTLVGVSVASAYYDQDGNWHEDIITEALETVVPTITDKPKDTQARKKAHAELRDKQKAARRKYEDTQEKIQRKKEDRRLKTQMKE